MASKPDEAEAKALRANNKKYSDLFLIFDSEYYPDNKLTADVEFLKQYKNDIEKVVDKQNKNGSFLDFAINEGKEHLKYNFDTLVNVEAYIAILENEKIYRDFPGTKKTALITRRQTLHNESIALSDKLLEIKDRYTTYAPEKIVILKEMGPKVEALFKLISPRLVEAIETTAKIRTEYAEVEAKFKADQAASAKKGAGKGAGGTSGGGGGKGRGGATAGKGMVMPETIEGCEKLEEQLQTQIDSVPTNPAISQETKFFYRSMLMTQMQNLLEHKQKLEKQKKPQSKQNNDYDSDPEITEAELGVRGGALSMPGSPVPERGVSTARGRATSRSRAGSQSRGESPSRRNAKIDVDKEKVDLFTAYFEANNNAKNPIYFLNVQYVSPGGVVTPCAKTGIKKLDKHNVNATLVIVEKTKHLELRLWDRNESYQWVLFAGIRVKTQKNIDYQFVYIDDKQQNFGFLDDLIKNFKHANKNPELPIKHPSKDAKLKFMTDKPTYDIAGVSLTVYDFKDKGKETDLHVVFNPLPCLYVYPMTNFGAYHWVQRKEKEFNEVVDLFPQKKLARFIPKCFFYGKTWMKKLSTKCQLKTQSEKHPTNRLPTRMNWVCQADGDFGLHMGKVVIKEYPDKNRPRGEADFITYLPKLVQELGPQKKPQNKDGAGDDSGKQPTTADGGNDDDDTSSDDGTSHADKARSDDEASDEDEGGDDDASSSASKRRYREASAALESTRTKKKKWLFFLI